MTDAVAKRASPAIDAAAGLPAEAGSRLLRLFRLRSLSVRLLLLTILFVMLAEVLIYVPSIARYRQEMLRARITASQLAALAVDTAPQEMFTRELEADLLKHLGAYSMEVHRPGRSPVMLTVENPPPVEQNFDLTRAGAFELTADAMEVLFRSRNRVIRVTGAPFWENDVEVSMVFGEAPLRNVMIDYSFRVLTVSILISLVTGGLVFVALDRLTARPIRRITEALVAFRRDPESAGASATLDTDRADEVGVAGRELISMQAAVRQALRQRERLAALGTAVTKINHDLRGILSTAALISERLLDSDDPEVRRIGPRLLAAIERAATLCGQTLAFTRDGILPLQRQPVELRGLVDEAGDVVAEAQRRTGNHAVLDWINEVRPGVTLMADREQLFRVLTNLGRNAIEAAATRIVVRATEEGQRLTLFIDDNGSGLAPRAREHLFTAFSGSTKANGSGLGLAIAREVARAHGGDVRLAETGATGTIFAITLPLPARN
jgi:signal transduction histidine kinase